MPKYICSECKGNPCHLDTGRPEEEWPKFVIKNCPPEICPVGKGAVPDWKEV